LLRAGNHREARDRCAGYCNCPALQEFPAIALHECALLQLSSVEQIASHPTPKPPREAMTRRDNPMQLHIQEVAKRMIRQQKAQDERHLLYTPDADAR
jgi:hypothetical protein